MSTAESDWEFDVAEEPEAVGPPTCDDTVPADERITGHWIDDKSKLEFRTAESDEAFLKTDTPVISLSNYR